MGKKRYSYIKLSSWREGDTYHILDNKKIWDAEKLGRGAGDIKIEKFKDKEKMKKRLAYLNKQWESKN